MLSRDQIRDVYSRMLFDQPELVSGDDIQLQYILAHIPSGKQASILDAGCGNGRYAATLFQHGYQHIHAIDLFEKLSQSHAFSYVQGSIDNLPYQASSFDFVYSNSVIYYLPDPERGISEFHRVLRSGGNVVLTAHTKYSLFTLIRLVQVALRLKRSEHLRGVRFYSAAEYASMLVSNGFQIRLIDGYKISALMIPLYRRVARRFNQFSPIQLPVPKEAMTGYRWLARFKSVFAYHSVIVATKI